jgi:hypothetical protein
MRRVLAAVMLLVSMFGFTGTASATNDLLEFQSAVDAMRAVDPTLEPPPNDGRRDFTVGAVHSTAATFAFSAHSGPLGEEPFGHISVTIAKSDSDVKQGRYRVTCLDVRANLAVVVGVPTRASDFPVPLVLMLRDGGPGGTLDGSAQTSTASPQDCHNPLYFVFAAGARPFPNGNILVRDAQP